MKIERKRPFSVQGIIDVWFDEEDVACTTGL